MQSKNTENMWLSRNLSNDEKALARLFNCEEVKLLKSPVTKRGACINSLIRGQVHDETHGPFEFLCDATYHTEEKTSSVVVEITNPNLSHCDDSDELHFFEKIGNVEMQLQLAISSEFRKWAVGEASVLQAVLFEVSNEEFSEIF